MSNEYFQEVLNDFEKLLTTEIGYDVIIYAGENENVKEFHAHSCILSTRTKYFHTTFSNELAEKKNEKFIFKKSNVSPELFEIILRFIYCGRIDLTKSQGPEVLKLLILVHELNIQYLISYIQNYLIKNQDEFLQQNLIGILETVYQHESLTDLWDCCLEKICNESKLLFESDKFTSLKAPILKLLLERDELDLDECIIWDSLLKWGLAQNPSISQDITKFTKWSKDDIKIMERTLHGLVPLIRFYHISANDFLDQVLPLRKFLPKDLFNDLLTFYIAPDRKPNVQLPRQSKFIYDSILVEHRHFVIFASWIDKKENSHYNVKNCPYNFNLLYRASRDGNTVAEFHNKCDNKGATIVVAKIAISEQIIGGYNPLYWESSDSWMSTFDSFIYFFTDKRNVKTAKVGYSNGNKYSIGNYRKYAPIFGGGWDLQQFSNGVWKCHRFENSSYPKIDGSPTEDFNVNEYEVFQVIKK
ncbi:hypothetical protein RclHR1_04930003 [Rhizophagus clarus]|uniref:BTB domain-containing protein n=1 Tax=Rhizophagus clarus TaxID=94130 RepID=A0A2Z6RJW4_9GLOM|nr:hypothetical protein RclHR1_04930003 [Rhizophagus clarus]GES84943.1 hypothetical protein GLOIN_2v1837915 [Rhizophagus clarus]